MILQSLHALYDRLKDDPDYGIAPPGWSYQRISFRVVIRPDGTLFRIEDARHSEGKRLIPRPRMVPGSTKKTGSGLDPCFLWDNTGYMLGYKPEDPDPDRSRRSFDAFRLRHLELESTVGSSTFSAVCRFLEGWDPARAADHEILTEITSGFGVFQIMGETAHVHDDPAVKAWWESRPRDVTAGPEGQCLVTGEVGPIAKIHEPKIKRVAGGQSSGSVIVGFNKSAYESYGRSKSHNAPVSTSAVFRYCVSLNALLDGPMSRKHRISVGDATVVFWTGVPTVVEDIFASFASQGSMALRREDVQDESLREKLEMFLRALRKGVEAYGDLTVDPDETDFFLLGLSPNAARVSIRFFHRGTLAQLLDNLRRHYADIGIERRWGADTKRPDPEFPSVGLLLDQTCPVKAGKPDRDKIPPILSGPLLRAILTGTRYPDGLFSAVMRRLRAERGVNYARACVIKGYLTRNLNLEVSMSLDTERPEPAYRLGRLFSTLEKTQGDALGKLNASIRDRYYSSASATPQSVFPRLLRTYQHHLAKLEGGRKVNREKLVQEILSALTNIPAHLDLAGQGLFALGYYHQTNDFYTKKEDPDSPETGEGDRP